MDIFYPSLWSLGCACLLLVLAAAICTRTRTRIVPNRLSLSATLAGWLVAIAISASVDLPSRGGGVVPSLAASAVGLFLLVPFYAGGGLGAGCVKMQMAFGAWVGCALGLPDAVWVTGLATVAGGLTTAIGASFAALRLRALEGPDACSFLYPAQVTLSAGSVCGVVVAGLLRWI